MQDPGLAQCSPSNSMRLWPTQRSPSLTHHQIPWELAKTPMPGHQRDLVLILHDYHTYHYLDFLRLATSQMPSLGAIQSSAHILRACS